MESKLEFTISGSVRYNLLIEPVWNRNFKVKMFTGAFSRLLIEPVWNRNSIVFRLSTRRDSLLIEPVWNRNPTGIHWSVSPVTFNRTSMESKRTSKNAVPSSI